MSPRLPPRPDAPRRSRPPRPKPPRPKPESRESTHLGPLGHGTFVIAAPRLRLAVRAYAGEDPINVTGMASGWQVEPRPFRTPLTYWRGWEDGRRLEAVGAIIDLGGESVEGAISALYRMTRVLVDGEPARVRVAGEPVPAQLRTRTWVIEGLTFGEAIVDPNGARSRQVVDLTFLEYRGAEEVDVRFRKTGKGTTTVVIAKAGDTLQTIAARELGSARRWRTLANLNGIRDPRKVRKGQRIKVPRDAGSTEE